MDSLAVNVLKSNVHTYNNAKCLFLLYFYYCQVVDFFFLFCTCLNGNYSHKHLTLFFQGFFYNVLCSTVVVKQLPYWLVRELLQKFSQFHQREGLHLVFFCVPGCGSSTLNGHVIVVNTAVGVPHVVWDVDTLHVVFDDPVVCRGNCSHQHIGFRALASEKIRKLGFMDPPGILIHFGVLRNHVG